MFREWAKFWGSFEMRSFKWTCCWECPTWTTLTLIFYWCNSSFLDPVDLTWEICGWGLSTSTFVSIFNWFFKSKIRSSKLFRSHISKWVHFKLISLESLIKSIVVISDIFKIFNPNTKSIWILFLFVVFVCFFFPDFKHKLFMWFRIWM